MVRECDYAGRHNSGIHEAKGRRVPGKGGVRAGGGSGNKSGDMGKGGQGIGIGGKRDAEDDGVLEAGCRGMGAVMGVHREKEKGGGIRC